MCWHGVVVLVVLVSSVLVSSEPLFFGPPPRDTCYSDRECPAIERTIYPGLFNLFDPVRYQRLAGRCVVDTDGLCSLGNLLGGNNRCRQTRRCAECYTSDDCPASYYCSNYSCFYRSSSDKK